MGTRLKLIVLENSNLKFGVTMMAIGFFKKMFFSDNISPMVNDIFNYPIGAESFTIILATIGFGIQIYCDFSGYSDIAIGAAMILGFKIPANFNRPYFATSPSDFWRRWHISLSSWLRDYLYITLGGNRVSKIRTYLNLFITMFLGGLWHGASWNFVLWGMLHGAYLAIHKLILDRVPSLKDNKFFKTKVGIVISIFITQYLVFLTWIPFRVSDSSSLTYSIWKYIVWDFAVDKTINVISLNKLPILLIITFIVLHYVSYKKNNLIETISGLKLRYWVMFLVAITFSILILYDGKPEDFIYFRF
jgi:D-alanyl-lipoteichoic acid acyltransferase DltB (MBOAT superfamily)